MAKSSDVEVRETTSDALTVNIACCATDPSDSAIITAGSVPPKFLFFSGSLSSNPLN